jgi:DNA-binding CsgD family transcriptional regulator
VGNVGRHDEIRILLCDGASLLSWLGGGRHDEPFSYREATLLGRVAEPFRARLKLERQLQHAELGIAALGCALDALDAAAYVVADTGWIAHANAQGAEELGRRGRALRHELRDAIRSPDRATYRVAALDLKGCPRYHLLIFVGADDDVARRAAWLRSRFALTARQTDVLALIARGDANKEIAVKLDISPRTVEVHVAALLEKLGCDSRARLVARFWQPTLPD